MTVLLLVRSFARVGAVLPLASMGDCPLPFWKKPLVKGAVESGAAVVCIRCGPTLMLYFASVVMNADGAIMVTGSHSPPDYGFKMMYVGKPFYADQICELGRFGMKMSQGPILPGFFSITPGRAL